MGILCWYKKLEYGKLIRYVKRIWFESYDLACKVEISMLIKNKYQMTDMEMWWVLCTADIKDWKLAAILCGRQNKSPDIHIFAINLKTKVYKIL